MTNLEIGSRTFLGWSRARGLTGALKAPTCEWRMSRLSKIASFQIPFPNDTNPLFLTLPRSTRFCPLVPVCALAPSICPSRLTHANVNQNNLRLLLFPMWHFRQPWILVTHGGSHKLSKFTTGIRVHRVPLAVLEIFQSLRIVLFSELSPLICMPRISQGMLQHAQSNCKTKFSLQSGEAQHKTAI